MMHSNTTAKQRHRMKSIDGLLSTRIRIKKNEKCVIEYLKNIYFRNSICGTMSLENHGEPSPPSIQKRTNNNNNSGKI